MDRGPCHVAIIPDGNRRWARARGKRPAEGHIAGAKAASAILEAALEEEIPYVTLWGASVANLTKRSKAERVVLYRVFREYFRRLAVRPEIDRYGVRVRAIGRWEEFFPPAAADAVRRVVAQTAANTGRHLTFLLGYSGIDEMLSAIATLRAQGSGPPTADELKAALWTRDLPPVDLVIRTGGEPHWSQGFLMWDVAEAQLAFTETLWPAFTPEEFREILETFRTRERRFGK